MHTAYRVVILCTDKYTRTLLHNGLPIRFYYTHCIYVFRGRLYFMGHHCLPACLNNLDHNVYTLLPSKHRQATTRHAVETAKLCLPGFWLISHPHSVYEFIGLVLQNISLLFTTRVTHWPESQPASHTDIQQAGGGLCGGHKASRFYCTPPPPPPPCNLWFKVIATVLHMRGQRKSRGHHVVIYEQ